jgi:hypothetical protein
MGAALGFSEGGSRLPAFVKGAKIAPYVGRGLAEKLENPIIFQSQTVGAGTPFVTTYGYDVTILIDLCKAIVLAEADGVLVKQQQHIAKQAHVILGASAKSGIKHLVYSLAGYMNPPARKLFALSSSMCRKRPANTKRNFPSNFIANGIDCTNCQSRSGTSHGNSHTSRSNRSTSHWPEVADAFLS